MDQKQYVLIFSTAYLPYIGGAELAIKEITDRLHDLHFILITARMRRDLPHRERMGNVDVCRVGVGIPFFDKIFSPILAACLVFTITRRVRVRLFWSVMVSYTTITPALLKRFGFYRNVPFLLTLQEGDSEKHIFEGWLGLIAYWWRASFRYANHVQVISTYLEKLARDFGYKGALTVVPNGVDTNVFYPRDVVKDKNLIVTTSRLVRKNAIDSLILAMDLVWKKVPEARLEIIGDGVDRGILEVMARSEENTNGYVTGSHIIFHGEQPLKKVPIYLAAARVFVRPSRSEGLGTAFLEAMAMGVPIVATRVGGIPDFLESGKTGLFAEVDFADDVAKQIIRVLTDDALYNRLSWNGREFVKEKYSWDAIVKRMIIIFKNLCAS